MTITIAIAIVIASAIATASTSTNIIIIESLLLLPKKIQKWWSTAAEGLAEALRKLQSDFRGFWIT